MDHRIERPAPRTTADSQQPNSYCTAAPGSADKPRLRDLFYYSLVGGAGKTRLLEAFIDLKMPELFGAQGRMSASEICERLALDPHRGWKFLHLLAMEGLLHEEGHEQGADSATFEISANGQYFFGTKGQDGYYFRDLLTYHRNVHDLPIVDVLRGMPLPAAVHWPPPSLAAAEHLETWMRLSAQGAIATIVGSRALAGAQRLLDVGGGDGTIGCALTEVYPELAVTVFNLTASAYLARKNIDAQDKSQRVSVCTGDFLKDELPGDFDRVMYSRVLTDWAPDVCVMLLAKARRALAANGKVIINEALVEGNEDYALAWEYRYLYYDSFGRAMFKPLAVYEQLLHEAGLRVTNVTPMIDDAFYSVIEAEPVTKKA